MAWRRQEEPISSLELLRCLAQAVAVYDALFAVGLGLFGALLGRYLRRPLVTGLAVWTFFELYWWSREHLFWGYPATSPERLGVAAGLLVAAVAIALVVARPFARLGRSVGATPALVSIGAALLGAGFFALEVRAAKLTTGAVSERNRDLPNVLLVVVDALRADVLGAYGNTRIATPAIDGLAARGVLFENAFVQAPFTWSSFGSILTGKYPRRHGMLKLGPQWSMVRDINTTLPLHLKRAQRNDGRTLEAEDWVTAAFMTGSVTRRSGLLEGFDLYCEALQGHELVRRSSAWSRFRSELLVFVLWNKATQRIDYEKAGSTAIEWLTEHGDRRFMAFLHLYSTHTPYDPRPEFRAQYVDPAYDGPVKAFYAEHRIAIEKEEYTPTPADVQQIRNLYYAGVAQADDVIARVLDVLRERGVLDDTLVIVTSDHGEELGEHGVWEHNWMYQTNLRVPLVLSWPRGLPQGVRVGALVETVDILPTLCDAMDLEPPGPSDDGELAKYHLLDGVSLLPLVRGDVESVKEFAFAESGPTLAVQDARTKLVISRECIDFDPGDRRWAEAKREPQLYDLARDPGETENLFWDRPEEVARLLGALAAWDASLPIPREEVLSSPRDLETEILLGNLGYADGIGDEEE